MSFFTNLRADRLVTEIRSSNDANSAATQKAIARLKDVGPGAIESVFAALPEADKAATMAFVEVLAGLVSQKTLPVFMRGLVEGSPRVISGISWALTTSRNYPPHLLLEALSIPGISKPTVLEVIAAQKSRFGVRELLAAAYTQEPNEKAALFRLIGEIADQSAIPELVGRLQGKDPIARVHIINTLARFNSPEVQNALQGLLKDPNKLIRGAVLSAMQRMNGPIDIERVSALLRGRGAQRDRQRQVRQVSARGAQGQRLVGAQPRRGRARQDRRPEGHRRRTAAGARQGRGHPPRGHRDPQPDQGRARGRIPHPGHARCRLVGERAGGGCAGGDRQQARTAAPDGDAPHPGERQGHADRGAGARQARRQPPGRHAAAARRQARA